jgi:hypothetical protein
MFPLYRLMLWHMDVPRTFCYHFRPGMQTCQHVAVNIRTTGWHKEMQCIFPSNLHAWIACAPVVVRRSSESLRRTASAARWNVRRLQQRYETLGINDDPAILAIFSASWEC